MLLLAASALCAAKAMAGEPAADGSLFGDPFPVRGQMPTGLPFLEVAPASAFLLPRGAFHLTMSMAYENTHAVSEDMLRTYGDGARHFLTPADLETIASGSREGLAWLVDGETLRLALGATWGVAPRLELRAELPLLWHTGGFLDNTIESYHSHLGFGDGGRAAFEQDRFFIAYADSEGTLYVEGAPGGIRAGDLLLAARTPLYRSPSGSTAVAATLGIELPTGDADRFDGNGEVDGALGIEASWRGPRSAVHFGGRYTRPGRWEAAPWLDLDGRASAYGAWQHRIGDDWEGLAQVLFGSGPLPHQIDGDLGDLTIEMTLGFRVRTSPRGALEMALLENLLPAKNSPDVGAWLGWRWSPEPGGGR